MVGYGDGLAVGYPIGAVEGICDQAPVLGVFDFTVFAKGGAQDTDGAFARGLDFEVEIPVICTHGFIISKPHVQTKLFLGLFMIGIMKPLTITRTSTLTKKI